MIRQREVSSRETDRKTDRKRERDRERNGDSDRDINRDRDRDRDRDRNKKWVDSNAKLQKERKFVFIFETILITCSVFGCKI